MLCKEVCKMCVDSHESWSPMDDTDWTNGKIMCPVENGVWTVCETKGPIPHTCLHKFEQAIAAGLEK